MTSDWDVLWETGGINYVEVLTTEVEYFVVVLSTWTIGLTDTEREYCFDFGYLFSSANTILIM